MMTDRLQGRLKDWPDAALSISLLAVAAILVVMALRPGHHLEKALTLAWVILP